MKRSMLIIAIAALCWFPVDGKGASLFGKVIDVSSGDAITVFNLNRPVRVKLLGADAPELDQAFGDVAKKHLADLAYDKSVLVEYSGIAADHSVAGRVLLNNTDIGAQMIRDGAAWFDPNNLGRLSATDREIYQQCEQAARNERRGLWQAENPTAPWEFVKAQSLRKNPYASRGSILTWSKSGDRPVPELTNLMLLAKTANATGPRLLSRKDVETALESLTPTHKQWREMKPAGHNFSVIVPGEGRQITAPVVIGGELPDLNMYLARDGANFYTVLWVTGPTEGETDKSVIDAMVLGYVRGSQRSYQQRDRGHFFCEPIGEKNISMNGYTGTEFDLSSCSLPSRVRAFTRVIGDERQFYMAVAFFGDEEEEVTRFLKSFTISQPKGKTRRR